MQYDETVGDVTEATETVTEPVVAATEEKQKRRHWHYEDGKAIVRDPDGSVSTYDVNGLAPATVERLAFEGFVARMSRPGDEVDHYAKIMRGEFRSTKAPAEKVLSPWRLAIAYARVDAKKKTAEPTTLDDAKVWAADLDTKFVREYKTDPAVVKHYRKLADTPIGAPSLAD